mgnify:CR=1 FL=1
MSELLNLDQMREISGLEFMQGILDGRYPSPPIGKTLGYYLTKVAEGRVVFSGAPSFDAFNPMGTVHGGWYGTLLDSAMACAVMTEPSMLARDHWLLSAMVWAVVRRNSC